MGSSVDYTKLMRCAFATAFPSIVLGMGGQHKVRNNTRIVWCDYQPTTSRPTNNRKRDLIAIPNQAVINSELPDLAKAQVLNVYTIPNLLCDEEIKRVLKFQFDSRNELGTTRRDGRGFRRVDGEWATSYLSTGGMMQTRLPELVDKMIDAAIEADKKQEWGLLNGDRSNLRIRVIELHTVSEGGALLDIKHHDHGSLVTVDVLMNDSLTDFSGGNFVTLEADGKFTNYSGKFVSAGDAVIFPSHKYHCVLPVTKGVRRVLVMELWRGEERTCAHRCLQHVGDCNYSIQDSLIDMFVKSAMPEVDPW